MNSQTERQRGRAAGFTLLELMVSVSILLLVAAAVVSSLIRMTRTQGTIVNRTEMHGAVRNVTEMLQQEVGQAGKVTIPVPELTLANAIAPGAATMSVAGPWSYLSDRSQLVVDPGSNVETATVIGTPTSGNLVTTTFANAHAIIGAPVLVKGAYASGVIPPAVEQDGSASQVDGTIITAIGANAPSTGFVLRLYGDLNDDITAPMFIVEYVCAPGTPAAPGILTRKISSVVPGVGVAAGAVATTILDNVINNPPDANGNAVPCFTYQTQHANVDYQDGAPKRKDTFVTNVAITLTVQTQARDVNSNQFQSESKALLNVAPRNVFEAWQLASAGIPSRVQPMPQAIKDYLAGL